MLAGASGGWKFLLAVTWAFRPWQCRADGYYCSNNGKCHAPARPDWFLQPCHLLPASSQSLPSPLHRRETRFQSGHVNHIHSLVQVEIIRKKNAGQRWARLGSVTFQPTFSLCIPSAIMGPVPSCWLLLFRPACQRPVQKQLSFPKECLERSVLCPAVLIMLFCVRAGVSVCSPQPCSCGIPIQANVLAGDELQSSWHELCLPPFGLHGCDPTWTEISWYLQDLSCRPASTSHPRMSFVNPIALY